MGCLILSLITHCTTIRIHFTHSELHVITDSPRPQSQTAWILPWPFLKVCDDSSASLRGCMKDPTFDFPHRTTSQTLSCRRATIDSDLHGSRHVLHTRSCIDNKSHHNSSYANHNKQKIEITTSIICANLVHTVRRSKILHSIATKTFSALTSTGKSCRPNRTSSRSKFEAHDNSGYMYQLKPGFVYESSG